LAKFIMEVSMDNRGILFCIVLLAAFALLAGCPNPQPPATFSVTYDDNGATSGTVPTDTAEYAQGQTVTVLGNPGNLARTSSVFAGWNLLTDETGTHYEAGSATFVMGSSDVILHAEWHPKLMALDAQASDGFGDSVAISGDYAIIGAGYEDAGGTNAGAAYIYHRTGINDWDAGTKIVASDAEAQDYFGMFVAISGDYAIVGAYEEDTGGDSAGAAYIFHRTDTNAWDAGTKISAPDATAYAMFGMSVAISGDYAVVGAWGEAEWGTSAGAAYIFHRTDTNTWDAGTKIVAPDAVEYDFFGWSVAISGDYAVVGKGGAGTPEAFVYLRTGTNTWDAGTQIVGSDTEASDSFGYSVAISGDYAIVGAMDEDAGGTDAGAAYLFHRTGTNVWDAGTKIVATDPQAGDFFGHYVGVSGSKAIVGAWSEDAGGLAAGAAYRFDRTGTNTWDAGTKIVAPDAEAADRFGFSVAISGDYGVIGAPFEGTASNGGAAYIRIIP
jgi:hypothetical protein